MGASVRAAFRATLAALVAFGFAGRTTPDRFDPGRIVILVVVDTLRADHVGIHGLARRDATPNLDRFARRGAWFLNAHSAAPWTPPSVQSLLTSLDPAVHGLNREGSAYAESIPRLSGRARPLAQLLAESGFRTNAITGGGGVDSRYGFDRGFESWFQPESVTGIDVESGVDKALAWLGRLAPGERAFLLLHTYEVHLPNTHHLFATEETGDDRSRASAAYDGDVAFADRELGRFFRELERTSLLPRSLVVVTADHGENLFDRVLGGRGVEHGHHLHDELTHVPLILVAPGLVPARGPIPGLVSPARCDADDPFARRCGAARLPDAGPGSPSCPAAPPTARFRTRAFRRRAPPGAPLEIGSNRDREVRSFASGRGRPVVELRRSSARSGLRPRKGPGGTMERGGHVGGRPGPAESTASKPRARGGPAPGPDGPGRSLSRHLDSALSRVPPVSALGRPCPPGMPGVPVNPRPFPGTHRPSGVLPHNPRA
ncbi:MAG: sulfatase [Holophagales bacterium]|nr:sulfatase [Holophagales bacterium]